MSPVAQRYAAHRVCVCFGPGHSTAFTEITVPVNTTEYVGTRIDVTLRVEANCRSGPSVIISPARVSFPPHFGGGLAAIGNATSTIPTGTATKATRESASSPAERRWGWSTIPGERRLELAAAGDEEPDNAFLARSSLIIIWFTEYRREGARHFFFSPCSKAGLHWHSKQICQG